MQIHISRDGQSFGPYTIEQVHNYLRTGQIKPTDLAWHEGLVDWKPLNTLPGFESAGIVPPVIPGSNEPKADYHHVSFTKFIIYSLCSFGIYDLYWFYKNWEFIRARDNAAIAPFWRMFFAPIWCYSLAKDVATANGNSSSVACALVAISYFALSIVWKLPDPYWLFNLLSFVPLLYIVWQIDQVNRAKSLRSNYYSRYRIAPIFGCLIGGLLVVLSTVSALNLIPATQVVGGERLTQSSLGFLKKAEIIDSEEAILYFYSAGMFSIEDDGNLITTDRVISYERDWDSGELHVYQAEYKNIQDIEVTRAESWLDGTVIYIALNDDDGFHLALSAEEDRDKLFIDKLMALWKQHRPEDANVVPE